MKNSTRGKSRKRMRLPNGFGRITKIKGRLRKPYRAMVTVGKDEYGKPIGKLLKPQSYFETYNEAYAALLEYNKDPFDVSTAITLLEIYEKWKDKKIETVSESSIRRYAIAWNYCKPLWDFDIRTIRVRDLKLCIEESGATDKFKISIKGLLNQVFEYALEYGYIEKNVVKDLRVKTVANTKSHIIFTKEEMTTLWENKDDYYVQMILILCYSGMRPGELLGLEAKNIDLVNNTMTGGNKTKAGIGRTIPIHPLIKDMIMDWVYERKDKNYDHLRFQLNMLNKKYGLNKEHKLHDGRKHFITLAKKYNVDEYALKRIVGHTITDITESVYTERNTSWLYDEMCKIKQY